MTNKFIPVLGEPAYLAVENVIIPNASLTNFDLEDAARKLNIPLRGVFCRNMLPKQRLEHEFGILNLDDSSGNGTHWTAWYIGPSPHGGKNGNIKIYFDSYGLQPPTELINYLRGPTLATRSAPLDHEFATRSGPIFYNSERVQPRNTVICGHLCLYVLKQLMTIENPSKVNFLNIINTLY